MRRFRKLVLRYQDRVFAFAYHYLRDADEAADVAQDVLIRFWEHFEKMKEEQHLPWLIRVTRNACIDAYRKRRLQRDLIEVDTAGLEQLPSYAADGDPLRSTESSELREVVSSALQRLPEPHRSIVMLREIQDMTYEEICAALELPMTTVKVYLHRGRRMLRELLSNQLIHETQSA